MSRHSRTPVSVSPLLWLAPLPFVLAMCLPMDFSPSGPDPGYERVAAAQPAAQSLDGAASAARARPR